LIKKSIGEAQEETAMTTRIVGSGLICATLLAVGFGFVIPVGGAVSALCDLLAVGSVIAFFALLDGA
jgi:hypothetical protein